MFPVPKGLLDWRMVYNGTSCGLNRALWAPHFGLPTMRHTLRSLMADYFQCDLDVGEMFLNFWLQCFLRPYAGVDVSHVRSDGSEVPDWEEERVRCWERWCQNFMGLGDSPYRSIQMLTHVKYLVYGDRGDPSNPFRWHAVRLNLPGSKDYDPSLPWVSKVRLDGLVACEVYFYVDDGRITGPTLHLYPTTY